MTILITGGTGQTGLYLARLLHKANHQVLLTSRSGTAPTPFKAVKFDWFDHSTFKNPFEVDSNIDKVYVVGSFSNDRAPHILPFLDLALSKGVKRIVLLSYIATSPGEGPIEGLRGVHEYLVEKGVDYAVLRPSWFIENLQTIYMSPIRDQNLIDSVFGDEKLPFIAAEDIAEVAFEALTVEPSPNTDYYILGPEFLTYDEVANIFSEVLGRQITHKRITMEEERARWVSISPSEEFTDEVIRIAQFTVDGGDWKVRSDPKTKIGRRRVREFIETNKEKWLAN